MTSKGLARDVRPVGGGCNAVGTVAGAAELLAVHGESAHDVGLRERSHGLVEFGGVKAAAEASIGRAANALKIISLAFIVLLRDQPKLSAVIVFIQLCRYWAARACSAGWALRYW